MAARTTLNTILRDARKCALLRMTVKLAAPLLTGADHQNDFFTDVE
jgi:hypothetical protein